MTEISWLVRRLSPIKLLKLRSSSSVTIRGLSLYPQVAPMNCIILKNKNTKHKLRKKSLFPDNETNIAYFNFKYSKRRYFLQQSTVHYLDHLKRDPVQTYTKCNYSTN